MGDHETVYYLATGEAAALVREFIAQERAAREGTNRLLDEFRAHTYWPGTKTFDYRPTYKPNSFEVAEPINPPPGMIRYASPKKGRGLWRPDRRSEEGKALLARIAQEPRYPSLLNLRQRLHGPGTSLRHAFGYGYGYEPVGEDIFITARPNWPAPTLPTCERVPASRYWLMREAREAAKAGEVAGG